MKCDRCQCLGIVRVENKEQGLDSLAYCNCEYARSGTQLWKIPQLNKKIAGAFTVTHCPLMWFLPDNERESVPRGWLVSSIDDKVIEWKARMTEAEKFWKDWGTLFDERPTHHMDNR